MANAFIMGRRSNPSGGGGNMPSGSQSFTANGTFTAPYTGVYTVVLTAGVARGGNGGNGGRSPTESTSSYRSLGGGGGAGGSAYEPDSPGVISVALNAGQEVPITVNTSVCSFGSYASFSTGSSGGNGGAGAAGATGGAGGAGGAGGSAPVWAAGENVTLNVLPSIPGKSLSGGDGANGPYVQYYFRAHAGGKGGNPSTVSRAMGAVGYAGSSVYIGNPQNDYLTQTSNIGSSPFGSPGTYTPVAATAGRIDIIWGNS